MTTDTEGRTANPMPRRRRRAVQPAARPAHRGTTAAATIHRDLRNDIVTLRRMPGEPVTEKAIADAYGVSRTPVREAILKLADEGLVEIFPQSGTFVARIPVADLPEAITIRRVLEEATVRFAAERATRSQIARLHACLEAQRERVAAEDYDGFHQSDEEFHALLAETAGHPGFWTVIQQVKVQVDRYRRLTLPQLGRMGMVVGEHQAIADAIADHDAERAVTAMRNHLVYLRNTIDGAQKANPRFFSTTAEAAG